MCERVCVSASFSLSPQGLEVTAVRKQIDFSSPMHKQLTTQSSIRHTLQMPLALTLTWGLYPANQPILLYPTNKNIKDVESRRSQPDYIK